MTIIDTATSNAAVGGSNTTRSSLVSGTMVREPTPQATGRGEDGSIMILALVMVVAFGLVAVAAGQYATSNLKDTIVTRDTVDRPWPQRAAARIALNQLQVDATFAASVGPGHRHPHRRAGRLATCRATSGASAGVGGFSWPPGRSPRWSPSPCRAR